MSREKTAIPDDLQQLSQRLEEWRGANPARTRLPESIWEAAVDMAQRHGLHCTSKALRMDYTRLKKRLPPAAQPPRPAPPAFLELVAAPTTGPVECVVELESACGRMRVSMKGKTPDWASLLQAWREAAR
jgi:hypothetical protein